MRGKNGGWADAGRHGLLLSSAMTESLITSRDNPVFKRLKKLADSARARRDARMTLLDSEHLIEAYLDAGGQPHTLLRAATSPAERVNGLAARCHSAKSLVLPDALFAELTPVATPTGVLAEAAWLEPPAINTTRLVIVLEHIQDPGNLGAMLRTGAAAGATLALLSANCHDPWSPKALRGGQGAQFVLPMQIDVDLPSWVNAFEGLSVALSLDETSGAEQDFYRMDFTGPLALVVGKRRIDKLGVFRRIYIRFERICIPPNAILANVKGGTPAPIFVGVAIRDDHLG